MFVKYFLLISLFLLSSKTLQAQNNFPFNTKSQDTIHSKLLPATIAPNYYYTSCPGFFCKQEIKRDKKSLIPLRFRLGSVAYCDKLEGKTK